MSVTNIHIAKWIQICILEVKSCEVSILDIEFYVAKILSVNGQITSLVNIQYEIPSDFQSGKCAGRQEFSVCSNDYMFDNVVGVFMFQTITYVLVF